MSKTSISLAGKDPLVILGLADENLNLIRRAFTSQIAVRGDRIHIEGEKEEVGRLKKLFGRLIKRARASEILDANEVQAEVDRSAESCPTGAPDECAVRTPKLTIRPKSANQAAYLRAIDDYDIVVAIGPAGTGKTYLAVARAVSALAAGKVERIVLTRPAVEAGESLGYLPGSFREKVDPYLRPLYDALYEMMPVERVERLLDHQVIEVAPLAFMRGRTLSDSYIILDEAQNTTSGQMKMFLTRLGWNSKAIVTGDITQIDLDAKSASGLVRIQTILSSIRGIRFVYFESQDVVRPRIVSEIIRAYDAEETA